MRLLNKVAIVTGAGSGFGEGIARTFAREGARVVVNVLGAPRGPAVAHPTSDGHEYPALFVRADVTDEAAVKAMVAAAQQRFGGLDIMVNTAGYTHRNKPMLEVTE